MIQITKTVVACNALGAPVKTVPLLEAHQGRGILHQAVSVMLFRKGVAGVETLLQKRSMDKVLWPGFWANTVCTHPGVDESVRDCAKRRLSEELGIHIRISELKSVFSFTYQACYTELLSEHEFDTLLFGWWDGGIKLNPDEVSEVKWIPLDVLKSDVTNNQSVYTPWLKHILSDSRFTIPKYPYPLKFE